ncbi:peptidase M50 [Chitinispirillum alkaliphilum]|nr:peptidase M50 [Chitinispirillum alkaliphilum]
MFGKRLKIFTLLGFEVYIDLSWIIIAVLIVWSLAQGVFPLLHEGLSPTVYWWMGVWGAIGLFASVILHEFSHSLVARRFGLPMKSITLFVFGGVAEMEEEPSTAKAEFFMAIAGPLASVAVGLAFWGFFETGTALAIPAPVLIIFLYLRTINFILAIFNMLPAFPLDGGRVFRSILWGWKGNIGWATRIASAVGSGFGTFLIILGVFSLLGGGVVGGLWWALIGLFIKSASRMSYEGVLIRGALEGQSVQKFTQLHPITVSPDTTLDTLVEDFIYRYHFNLYPVVQNGQIMCIDIDDVKSIPEQQRKFHRVKEYMKPCSKENSVEQNESALKAFNSMNKSGKSRLMVLNDEGQLEGTISQRDIMKYLSLKLNNGNKGLGDVQGQG